MENQHYWKELRGQRCYCGPDHSTKLGAMRLADRLNSYWIRAGKQKQFEVFNAGEDCQGHFVYGVRELTVEDMPPLTVAKNVFPVGPTPRERIRKVIEKAARPHGISCQEVMSSSVAAPVVAARRDAIRAVYNLRPQRSYPEVAAIFGMHHATVHAIVNDKLETKRAQARARRARVLARAA